jgi:hypothetical protein
MFRVVLAVACQILQAGVLVTGKMALRVVVVVVLMLLLVLVVLVLHRLVVMVGMGRFLVVVVVVVLVLPVRRESRVLRVTVARVLPQQSLELL